MTSANVTNPYNAWTRYEPFGTGRVNLQGFLGTLEAAGGIGLGATGPTGSDGSATNTGATGPTGGLNISGTNYGDYLYWNGSTFAVGDARISLGANAGNSNQSTGAVAVGNGAGNSNQGLDAVAIGNSAGSSSQGTLGVAIGNFAAYSSQGSYAVAAGYFAGGLGQGTNSVAIGTLAGSSTQGANAIAIGTNAGQTNQAANSIVLNASGIAVNPVTSGTFVNPIRSVFTTGTIYNLIYNPTSSELTALQMGVLPQLYVSPGGSNTNSGFSFSSPFQSIQHAVDLAAVYSSLIGVGGFIAQGSPATINLGTGTFYETVNVSQGNYVVFNGLGANATTWNGGSAEAGTLISNFGAQATVQNLTLAATGLAGQSALYSQVQGLISVLDGVNFGPANNSHMFTENAGSQIQIWSPYTISGSAVSHAVVTTNSYIEWDGATTVTLVGTPHFSGQFVWADNNGIIYMLQFTPAGSATGKRFLATAGGIITVAPAGGLANLPGDTPGTTNNSVLAPWPSPTVGVVGAGGGGSASISSGNVYAGIVQLVIGTSPSTTLMVTLTAPVYFAWSTIVLGTLNSSSSAWPQGSTITGSVSSQTAPFIITTPSALSAGTYYFCYFFPQP